MMAIPTCSWDRLAQHPVICLAPGLFGSAAAAKSCQGIPWRVECTYQGRTEQWIFEGPTPLSFLDYRVFMALTAAIHWSRDQRLRLGVQPNSEVGRTLRRGLALQGIDGMVYAVRTAISELTREAGYTESRHLTTVVRASLERLHATRVTRRVRDDACQQSRLIHYVVTGPYRRPVLVAMNPWVSALQDRRAGGGNRPRLRYAQGSLAQMRILVRVSEVAVRIYWRLCGWVDPGGSAKKVALKTLMEYGWGPATHGVSDRVRRYRRARTQEAVQALTTIGWQVAGPIGDRQIYTVAREI
ncbi:MAG: replication protein C, IncQ-type [Thermaerobacter sp.]|nr:replication protein C, IncQ-type [Thermaerobacter sp.]